MIEKIYDINGAYELFGYYNGLGNQNCIFYMVNDETISLKDVAKGVTLGIAFNAVGLNVIGVSGGGNNSNQIGGYLVNLTENGIGLIPLKKNRSSYSIKHMEIIPNSYIFIRNEDIRNIKIEQPLRYFMDSSIRIVTIDLINGEQIKSRAYTKNKYVKYQEFNFGIFMNIYGFQKSKNGDLIRNILKSIFCGLLLAMLVAFIAGIVLAFSSIDNNTNNNVPETDTGKIKIDIYKPQN